MYKFCFIINIIIFQSYIVFAQQNTITQPNTQSDSNRFSISSNRLKAETILLDSIKKEKTFFPHIATVRSAILPGWGQLYNKKYWKLPIIYAGLGVTAYIFFDNKKTYKDFRFAYAAKYKITQDPTNTTDWNNVASKYKSLSLSSLQYYRNQYRQYIDYSALVFLVLWGLNVVDATVDAHLKNFDVSNDLSINLKAGYNTVAGTNGVSIVLNFK